MGATLASPRPHWGRRLRGGLLALGLLVAAAAGAVGVPDRFALALGRASEIDVVQAEAGWDWRAGDGAALPAWLAWTRARSLSVEATVAAWRSRVAEVRRRELFGAGLRPTLRWAWGPAGRVFVEFGTGPRLWSGTFIGRHSRFGTLLEFGTIAGAGVRVGAVDLFVRLEHTSNASIRKPNPGLDMVQLGLAWPSGGRGR
jgi:lipid A 3-O-deacylase